MRFFVLVLIILLLVLDLSSTESELFLIKSNHFYGYQTASSSIVILPQFLEARSFYSNFAIVKNSNTSLWGVINLAGETIIPPNYTQIFDVENNHFLIKDQQLWGLITTKNEWIVKPQWTDAWGFQNGLAEVQKNGKWGFINSDGVLIFPFIFEDSWFFNELMEGQPASGRAVQLVGSNWQVCDPALNLTHTGFFAEGLAIVKHNKQFALLDKSSIYKTETSK